jgi:hypothetical protein
VTTLHDDLCLNDTPVTQHELEPLIAALAECDKFGANEGTLGPAVMLKARVPTWYSMPHLGKGVSLDYRESLTLLQRAGMGPSAAITDLDRELRSTN